MLKNEIIVGGEYTARISGNIVIVRVDAIREASTAKVEKYSGLRTIVFKTVFDVTNLRTGRQTTFRSAAKFRSALAGRQKMLRDLYAAK